LRKKSSTWLFPGNRWHTGARPIDTKTPRHACQYAARRAGILFRSTLITKGAPPKKH